MSMVCEMSNGWLPWRLNPKPEKSKKKTPLFFTPWFDFQQGVVKYVNLQLPDIAFTVLQKGANHTGTG